MRRGWSSLSGRLMRSTGLALTAAWLASTLLSGLILGGEINEAYDIALRRTASQLAPIAAAALRPGGSLAALDDQDLSFDHNLVAVQVRGADGALLMRSADAPEAPFAAALDRGFARANGFRVYTARLEGGYLQVGDALGRRRQETIEATLGLLGPLAFLLPAMLAAVWWITRRSLAPLAMLRDEIARRGGEDLSAVPAADMPRELVPIVAALNRLLDRLQRGLDAEHGFAANAAHELRTPLAGALAETQLLASETKGAPRRRVDRIEASLKRMARLSEKLLDLARADTLDARLAGSEDLLPSLRLVIGEFASEPVRLDPAPGRIAGRIDPDAFAIVARNLIENALRHGDPGAAVIVTAEPTALRVTNAGPAVPADALRGLTERFRGGGAPSSGAGLGLAIADTIARRSGAALSLRSPAPGRRDGFEARLDLGA